MVFIRSDYQPRHAASRNALAGRGKSAVLALSLVGVAVAATTDAQAASAVSSKPGSATKPVAAKKPVAPKPVTRYTTANTNVRTGAGTRYRVVSKLPAKAKVTGTLVGTAASASWLRLTSPSSVAGKYISTSVLSPIAPPATATMTLFVAANGVSSYAAPSTSSAKAPQAVGSRFTVWLLNSSWALIASGPSVGRVLRTQDLTTTNPAAPLVPSTNTSSRARVGAPVTRWVAGFSGTATSATVRSGATTHSTALGSISYGTALTGAYVSRNWFRIDAGDFVGSYVNAAQLVASPNFKALNGRGATADLCALPSYTQTTWEPTTKRYLDCTAVESFVQMNNAFRAQFGYNLTLNEGYRDIAKQKFFYTMWGSPRAAYPGTSNHGFGAAIDFGKPAFLKSNPYVFGGPADRWLSQNSQDYGFDRPDYLDQGHYGAEFWHYNYIG